MKKFIIVIATIVASTALTPHTAQATGRGPCSENRFEVTQSTPHRLRIRKMRKLIRCVFRAVGIREEIPTALMVGGRESGLRPWAKNPEQATACRPYGSSPYGSCGLFQHLARYWPGRVRRFLDERKFPSWPRVSVLQARANVFVTAKMVRLGGWGPWTTAP